MWLCTRLSPLSQTHTTGTYTTSPYPHVARKSCYFLICISTHQGAVYHTNDVPTPDGVITIHSTEVLQNCTSHIGDPCNCACVLKQSGLVTKYLLHMEEVTPRQTPAGYERLNATCSTKLLLIFSLRHISVVSPQAGLSYDKHPTM